MKINEVRDFLDRECRLDTVTIISVTEGKNNKGNKYLSMVLQDSTGTIDGKKWEVLPGDEKIFAPKNVIAVEGYPNIYNQSQLQFKITDAEYIGNLDQENPTFKLEDLVIEAPVNRQELEEEFFMFLDSIQNQDIKTIVSEVVESRMDVIAFHPAAKTNHHDYAGGLLHHEVSMLRLAKQIATLYPSINQDLLFGGIILHDLGKCDELSGPIATEYTFKGKLLGHISIIQTDIVEAAKKHHIEGEVVTLLQHMVLSHHGKYEFGSPVLPVILEAEVMYQIDNIDSKIVMINKALKDVEPGGFSNRVMGLDGRAFYKHK